MRDALTTAYQQELKRTRAAVSNAVKQHWLNLPEYRDAQVDPFLRRVTPLVHAGQRRAIALTDAYLSHKLGTKPLGLDVDSLVGNVRNGVSSDVVYTRPFQTVWSSVKAIGFAAALAKATSRLTSTVDMDLMMSQRDATRAYGQANDRIVAWQRVADPSCCDFCQTIDGAKCYSEDASPLHNNCGCTLEPIDSSSDSNSNDFVSFTAGSVFGDVALREHGEMGLLITDKDYDFTGPEDF